MDNTQDLCNIEDSGDAGRERSPEHCSSSTAVDSGFRLFDRQRSIRQIMGGGKGNNTTVFSVLAWALLKPGFCKHEGRLKFDVNLENKESLLSLCSFLYAFLAYIFLKGFWLTIFISLFYFSSVLGLTWSISCWCYLVETPKHIFWHYCCCYCCMALIWAVRVIILINFFRHTVDFNSIPVCSSQQCCPSK